MDDDLHICNSYIKVSRITQWKHYPTRYWIGCSMSPMSALFATKQVIAKPTWPDGRCYRVYLTATVKNHA